MDYLKAAKPRIVALLLLTELAAVLLAGERRPAFIVSVLIATGLTVAGAAVLNNYLERDTDARMERTRARPTAAGALAPESVLAAGLTLALVGVAGLWSVGGVAAAVLGAAGTFYYLVVYTLVLKPRTALSALPGALAGVFPALIGWAACGAPATATILYLCAVVVVWSPPHFWALTYALKREYVAAGIPTPAAAYGDRSSSLQILACVTALTALTMLPVAAGVFGVTYLAVALVTGTALWLLALRLTLSRTESSGWRLYRFSGPYLATIIVAMLLDRLLSWSPPGVLGG